MKSYKQSIFNFAIFGSISLIPVIAYRKQYTGWTLFPWFQGYMYSVNTTEKVLFLSIISLLVAVLVKGNLKINISGLMSPYILMLIIDIIMFPSSHNLWPFEFIYYVFVLAFPSLIIILVHMAKKNYLRRRDPGGVDP